MQTMDVRRWRRRAWRGWIGAGGLLLLTACAPRGLSFMTPAGPVADAERTHLWLVTVIALVVVLPVLLGVPWLAWRYRRRARATYAPDWDYSRTLERLMWGVPVLIVVVLGALLTRETLRWDPYAPLEPHLAPLRVEAIGLSWNWLFVYPDLGVASLNELAIPAGRPVSIRLTSDTVMQSFFIGALGGQIYAMPGMQTRLHLLADRPGIYEGENTQYSGFGFQHQKFTARALSATDYAAWLERVRRDGVVLDAARYAILGHAAEPDRAVAALSLTTPASDPGVAWFSSVTPGLFDAVLHRYMDGRPLPDAAQPGSPAYRGIAPMGWEGGRADVTRGNAGMHGMDGMQLPARVAQPRADTQPSNKEY